MNTGNVLATILTSEELAKLSEEMLGALSQAAVDVIIYHLREATSVALDGGNFTGTQARDLLIYTLATMQVGPSSQSPEMQLKIAREAETQDFIEDNEADDPEACY